MELESQRSRVLAALAELDARKPSYSDQGRSVQWTAHRAQLMAELESLRQLIAQAEPFVITTRLTP